jgi:NAD(P)-dependent dehydrogenase (short-subunit alcohol dehydrogenase family)
MSTRAPIDRRTVIITGGTAGVGRALAHRFAQAGDRVGVVARDTAALKAVAEELESMGAEAVAVESVDVADAEALFAAAERLEQHLGTIDVWINNAMETILSSVADLSPQEFRRVTDVTYLGYVHGTMAALKSMRPRRRGRIIQIGSALAHRGIPLQSAYCGAKYAIRGFTDSLRTEMLHEGLDIHLSTVELPAVNTPQFSWARVHLTHTPRPMGRPVEPEVVAEAVFRSARRGWHEYWLGWSTMSTILGNFVWPGFLDRYLAKNAVAGQQTAQLVATDRRDNLERPVTDLHRTRGPFSSEAGSWAPLIPGELARVGALVAVGALLVAVGVGLGSARRTR